MLLPFFTTVKVSQSLGLNSTTIRELFDAGTLTGFRTCRDRKIDRRSIVRWLRSRGMKDSDIPRQFIYRIQTIGLPANAETILRKSLPSEDFILTDRHPDILVADLNRAELSDAVAILHCNDIRFSLAIAPEDGSNDAIRQAMFTRLENPPVRWPSIAALLRSQL